MRCYNWHLKAALPVYKLSLVNLLSCSTRILYHVIYTCSDLFKHYTVSKCLQSLKMMSTNYLSSNEKKQTNKTCQFILAHFLSWNLSFSRWILESLSCKMLPVTQLKTCFVKYQKGSKTATIKDHPNLALEGRYLIVSIGIYLEINAVILKKNHCTHNKLSMHMCAVVINKCGECNVSGIIPAAVIYRHPWLI